VKQRLAIVEWAMEHGIKPAGQRFGLDHQTIREWRDRCGAQGIVGLVPTHPDQRTSRRLDELVKLIEHAWRERQYGAARTRIWLRRVFRKDVPMATIHRRGATSTFR
jgi:hypothetical protein